MLVVDLIQMQEAYSATFKSRATDVEQSLVLAETLKYSALVEKKADCSKFYDFMPIQFLDQSIRGDNV